MLPRSPVVYTTVPVAAEACVGAGRHSGLNRHVEFRSEYILCRRARKRVAELQSPRVGHSDRRSDLIARSHRTEGDERCRRCGRNVNSAGREGVRIRRSAYR